MGELNLDELERQAEERSRVGPVGMTVVADVVLTLIARIRELERMNALAYQNGFSDGRKFEDQYAKGWNDARRATDGQWAGVPEPFASICREELARRKLTSHPLKFAFAKERGMADLDEVHDWMQRTARAFEEAVQALPAAPTPHAACPAPVDATEAAEREHMGCAHCGTGIYATPPAGDAGQERDRKDAERYAYVLYCEVVAARKYLPNLDAEEFKAKRRAAHDAAIAASKPQCDCLTCIRERGDTIGGLPRELCEMIVCTTCGNKRCPKANDHRNACTGSNEPGQPGSAYRAMAANKGDAP